jgi:Tfp pilus assembly protein PilF
VNCEENRRKTSGAFKRRSLLSSFLLILQFEFCIPLRLCASVVDFSSLMSDERVSQLKEILAQDAKNQMARYALALEFMNAGQFETAMLEFRQLLVDHPTYVPGHQMLAQTMMRAGLTGEARDVLKKGIETASASGNAKARDEMQGMLDEIG